MSVIDAHINPDYPTPRQQENADMADALQSLGRTITRETAADCIVKFGYSRGDDGTWRLAIESPLDGGAESLADSLVQLLSVLDRNGVHPKHTKALLKIVAAA